MSRRHIEIDPKCGRRLKGLLIKNKVPQCDLAAKLGYEPQHISNIVRGKRRLTPEMAYPIADMFHVRAEWLLGYDDFETQRDREVASKQEWEKGQKVSEFYDKIFRCFIEGLEDMRGYGISTGESDYLIGEYVAVTNAIGDPVGAIPAESFQRLQTEVENYASYLVQRIIQTEMRPVPQSGKEGIEKWQTFKSAGTKTAD